MEWSAGEGEGVGVECSREQYFEGKLSRSIILHGYQKVPSGGALDIYNTIIT